MPWKFNIITNLEFWIRLQSFKRKIENKNIFCGSETLIDREWHLALEIPTLRTAHTDRERERETPVKQHQGKAWATKAQRDWPVNMAINSRLIVCKAEIGEALYYAKPALKVDPYFQDLALIKL
jgi:hypothetical protein